MDTIAEIMGVKLEDFKNWGWESIQPLFDVLEQYALTRENVVEWLTAWSRLSNLLEETYTDLYVGTTVDTSDTETEQKYFAFLDGISEPASVENQKLKQKLLATGIEPPDYDLILKMIRQEAALFREANVPLLTEEARLTNEFDKIMGAQTVQWEGSERTVAQMNPLMLDNDRSVREQAWRLRSECQLADRATLDALWVRMLKLRVQIAANADEPDYRAYQWKNYHRFDYTPEDCMGFHDAIERVVVPAAVELRERRRERLGVETLRPWDTDVDAFGRTPLTPFTQIDTLVMKAQSIFQRVDPQLGGFFVDMMQAEMLDLDNRKNKAPGGYCTYYAISQRPYIFMNAVGIHDDVQTLLHEGGHAFHAYETTTLPEYRRVSAPTEFCEVASMSMELLGGPYLARSNGGYYDEVDAARARIEHLERLLMFWPYMAVVDAFQHWVYTHVDDAYDPAKCDAKWGELWDRFMKGIDYSGFDDEKVTGWHRKLHIFQIPFYYVEYGIAQVGAVQVWLNSLRDATKAVADYRHALALGGTVPLPELFATAGARLAMNDSVLKPLVDAIMSTIGQLETV